MAFLHDFHDPGKPLGNGANGNTQSDQRRSSAPQGRRVQGAGFQAVKCFREPLGGRLQQLCRDRQQGHEAKDRTSDLRELVGVDPAHHVHGPGQDQDRGGHAGQGLGALVLLPGLDRAGQLLEGAGDGVEHSGQRGLQHCFQALGGFCHLPDAERQQSHVDQAHKPVNVRPADGIKALFHSGKELFHRGKGIPHRAVDLVHAALEAGSKLTHGFAQVLRHVDEVLLEVLQIRLCQPQHLHRVLTKAPQFGEQGRDRHAQRTQDANASTCCGLDHGAQSVKGPSAHGVQGTQQAGALLSLFQEGVDVLRDLRVFQHAAQCIHRAQELRQCRPDAAQLLPQGAASGGNFIDRLKEIPQPGSHAQHHLCHRLRSVRQQRKCFLCHSADLAQDRGNALQHREQALEGLLDLLCGLVGDDKLLGHQVEPFGKAVNVFSVCGREDLTERLLHRGHYFANGIHDVPEALHQMLSAGKLADLLGVLVQVQGSILNLGVQLRKGFRIPLDGLPVITLCGHLLVAQGQQLFSAGLCFVKACFQQLGTHAVLLQCLGKTARFGDLVLGHSTTGQCHLLEGVAVGIRLIPQPALQLCPSAVQSILQPFVQPVDAGHENVVQPIRKLCPCVGGLFLVAKEGLEDGHPF